MSQQCILLESISTTIPETISVKHYQNKSKIQKEDCFNNSNERSQNKRKLKLNLAIKQKVCLRQSVPFVSGREMIIGNRIDIKRREYAVSQTQLSDCVQINSKSQCEIKRSKSILKKRRTLNSEGTIGIPNKNVRFGSEVTPLTQIIPIESYRKSNHENNRFIDKLEKAEKVNCGCCIY